MLRKIILMFVIIISINNIYSFNETCDYQFLEDNELDLLLVNNSFRQAVDNITQDMLDTNMTKPYQYTIFNFDKNINFFITFENDVVNNDLFGVYIHNSEHIIIYVGNIYDTYKNSTNSTNKIKDNVELTLKHELMHYVDSHYNFVNITDTLNLELNQSDLNQVLNLNYYIDLFDNSSNTFMIPPHIKWTLDFTWTFLKNNSAYTPDQYKEELIARNFAICIEELNNSIWGYKSIALCNNFNFNTEDLISINDISRIFMRGYLKEVYPSYTKKVISLDDRCALVRETQYLPKISRDISGFLSNFSIGLVQFLLSFGIVVGIIILFVSLIRHIIKYLK